MLLVAFLISPSGAVISWTVQTVDTASIGAGQVAIDSDDNLYVLYQQYETDNPQKPVLFRIASKNESGWTSKFIPLQEPIYDYALKRAIFKYIQK